MRKARATFSQNYLECAGFHVESHIGFNSVKEASQEIGSENVDFWVLCSSDDKYPDLVSDFCTEFGKNSVLILAGYPKDKIADYREAGIDLFIFSGSNMIETLKDIQKRLGIG
jgi:methylmalonyl-CoA mutase